MLNRYDYLIVGAGPAGLQLGYYLERAGYNFLILEKGLNAGTFFTKFPRHRTLISINKVYTGCSDRERNLRWDWNSLLTEDPDALMGDYTKEYFPGADHLVDYLQDFAEKHVSHIRYNTEVHKILRDQQGFHAHITTGDVITGGRLICATGMHKRYTPPIPGIELAEPYDKMSLNPEDFTNQRVLIIGKGNSAFETADHLISHAATIHMVSPNLLKFAWKTHFVGHLRAVNNNFLDTYQLKSQNGVLDATVENIERDGDGFRVMVTHHRANDTQVKYHYDRILSCTGFQFNIDLFDESCQPELDSHIKNRFPRQTEQWESVNIPHLFFAGVLMQQRDYGKSSSGFIHGFRHNIQALFHILNHRYHHVDWPSAQLASQEIAPRIIESINRSSALMLQFDFMADLFVLSETGLYQYYKTVPIDFIRQGDLTGDQFYLMVTLEYGQKEFDPFYDNRVSEHDPDNAAKSTALHPVIRFFRRDSCIAEQHLVENLEADWSDERLHVAPLQRFLDQYLRSPLMHEIANRMDTSVMKRVDVCC